MTDSAPSPRNIHFLPSADHPGWLVRTPADGFDEKFNAVFRPTLLKAEDDGTVTVRFFPTAAHGNINGVLHGGALLGFLDIAMFIGARLLGVIPDRAVTVDIQVQFAASGRLDLPVDANIEIVRTTGSLIFERGTVQQGEGENATIIASYTGLLKKLSQK